MKDVVKAYIAGIVDGEGTVTLSRHHKNETPSPVVSVSNNDLFLLQWIKSQAGGLITSKRKQKSHHRNSYVWKVRNDKAIWLLKELMDFLIVKRRQAKLITDEYKNVTHRAGKYSAELIAKKGILVDKIRTLNHR